MDLVKYIPPIEVITNPDFTPPENSHAVYVYAPLVDDSFIERIRVRNIIRDTLRAQIERNESFGILRPNNIRINRITHEQIDKLEGRGLSVMREHPGMGIVFTLHTAQDTGILSLMLWAALLDTVHEFISEYQAEHRNTMLNDLESCTIHEMLVSKLHLLISYRILHDADVWVGNVKKNAKSIGSLETSRCDSNGNVLVPSISIKVKTYQGPIEFDVIWSSRFEYYNINGFVQEMLTTAYAKSNVMDWL